MSGFSNSIKRGYTSTKKFIKNHLNLPIIIVLCVLILGAFHIFSYVFPFTDNAFVVTNITPIAADVSGFITDIYVKNGQIVRKNQPIFTVYQVPYHLAHQEASANYQEGKKKIIVYEHQIAKTRALMLSTASELEKAQYELKLKKNKQVLEAVSTLEVKKLSYDVDILKNRLASFENEINVLKAQIAQQEHSVASLRAKMNTAKVNLDLTVVRAPGNGVIDNMYLSANTPIKIHQPVFSFIDTSNFYVQANFNETDLRNVRAGDKAYIILRMYYFSKIFHGVVVNTMWAAERQVTAAKSQIQQVSNENEWLLLPQRFPVQIRITDADPDYPLNPGSSAYVYISTKK